MDDSDDVVAGSSREPERIGALQSLESIQASRIRLVEEIIEMLPSISGDDAERVQLFDQDIRSAFEKTNNQITKLQSHEVIADIQESIEEQFGDLDQQKQQLRDIFIYPRAINILNDVQDVRQQLLSHIASMTEAQEDLIGRDEIDRIKEFAKDLRKEWDDTSVEFTQIATRVTDPLTIRKYVDAQVELINNQQDMLEPIFEAAQHHWNNDPIFIISSDSDSNSKRSSASIEHGITSEPSSLQAKTNLGPILQDLTRRRAEMLEKISALPENYPEVRDQVHKLTAQIKDSQKNVDAVLRFSIPSAAETTIDFVNNQRDIFSGQDKEYRAILEIVRKRREHQEQQKQETKAKIDDLFAKIEKADPTFLSTVNFLRKGNENVFKYLHSIVSADSAAYIPPAQQEHRYKSPKLIKSQFGWTSYMLPGSRLKFKTTVAQHNVSGEFVGRDKNKHVYIRTKNPDNVRTKDFRSKFYADTINLQVVADPPRKATTATKTKVKKQKNKTIEIPTLHIFPGIQEARNEEKKQQVRLVMNVPNRGNVILTQQMLDALHANAPALAELHAHISNQVILERVEAANKKMRDEFKDPINGDRLITSYRRYHDDVVAEHRQLQKRGIRPWHMSAPDTIGGIRPWHMSAPDTIEGAVLKDLRRWEKTKQRPVPPSAKKNGKEKANTGFVKEGGRYLGTNPALIPPASNPQKSAHEDIEGKSLSPEARSSQKDRESKAQTPQDNFWKIQLPAAIAAARNQDPTVSEENALKRMIVNEYANFRENYTEDKPLEFDSQVATHLMNKYVEENGSNPKKGKMTPADFVYQQRQIIIDWPKNRPEKTLPKKDRPHSPDRQSTVSDGESQPSTQKKFGR